jgi:hypothetical protein
MSVVLRRWMQKSFFIFFIPGIANTAIPFAILHMGQWIPGIGKVLRILSQWAKNTLLEA